MSVQVEEFDIGDEMKSAPVRTWMMKKDPEIDPGVFFHLYSKHTLSILFEKSKLTGYILLDNQLKYIFQHLFLKHVTGLM